MAASPAPVFGLSGRALDAAAKRRIAEALLAAWLATPSVSFAELLAERTSGVSLEELTDQRLWTLFAPPSRPAQRAPGAAGAAPIGSDRDAALFAFASEVNAVARGIPPWAPKAGKVFVADIWNELLRVRSPLANKGVGTFKARLVDANRLGFLDLSRADLVEAMDPEKVRASEILSLGATFHFVRVREGKR